jgi:tRNA(Ile)-lysidine synthase
MSEFSPPRLLDVLDSLLSNIQSRQFCVALSGGLDSVVLLHALVQLRNEQSNWQLRAVHINHQLQKDATQWAQQCLDQCASLNVPCKVLAVDVQHVKDKGVEAAARTARYTALSRELETDEVLLTAHHADDQLETMMIALMRGAGLDGLAAMPAMARFKQAWHARPLLSFTRTQLQAWATTQALSYVDDPTNEQTHFDRNFLRAEVIPRLKERWPAAAVTAARSASHLSEALHLANNLVTDDLTTALTGNALNVSTLMSWSPSHRRAVIRQWLQRNEVLMPSSRVMSALEHDMFHAADDRIPCIRWGEYAVHRYQDHLHLEKTTRPEAIDKIIEWRWHNSLQLPHQLGSLCIAPPQAEAKQVGPTTAILLNASTIPAVLTVRFREGGEQLQLSGESIHRELKKLLQDAAVLPWWRGRLPLIYAGEKLVAVAGFWVNAEFAAVDGHPEVALLWQHSETLVFAGK